MSTIVEVLNRMIENKEKIDDTIFFKEEVYFLYDKKFLWSIKQILWSEQDSRSNYTVKLYPNANPSQKSLFDYIEDQHNDLKASQLHPSLGYISANYPTVAANDTFTELYLIVSRKASGADDVFQAILNS